MCRKIFQYQVTHILLKNKNMEYSRRQFLKTTAFAGASVVAASAVSSVEPLFGKDKLTDASRPFKMKYAPSLGMFKESAGADPIDNIKFCHDMGFKAMFDNGMMGRPADIQEKIMRQINAFGMEMGPFVLYADFKTVSFALNNSEVSGLLEKKMREGVECFKRTGIKQALVVPGKYDQKLHPDYQTANVIDNLRRCCDIVEEAGLTIVLEPLNRRDHPGLFLTGIPQAYSICRGVNRKSCKIVNDIYHQQISEGNIIPNIEDAWDEIASFHLGDNPGRKEPLTGEINFKNIFKYLYEKGYEGVLCMEHGKSVKGREGEIKLINAYRECDI